MNRRRLAHLVAALAVTGLAAGGGGLAASASVRQESYQRISGEGSSWSAGAIDAMRVNVKQFGITVDYNPSGSTSGRKRFLDGIVDFAASDIPFQFSPEDGSAPENPADGSYAYIPVTAGGTAFMYNLKVGGRRVTNLRLSGANVAKIFTGTITTWNDPALLADNPGLDLPTRPIVPVVRSDGSGSSAQFTRWLISQHGGIWQDYCERAGRAPACGSTSFYPTIQGFIAQSGDPGVAAYVGQSFAEGAIGYVNYSYALNSQFPVAKVLNAAGYYTEPTPENVAVSLLRARINQDQSDPAVYLTQNLDDVYTDGDARNYQLSSYSYFILPTRTTGQFNEAKGRTLGAFTYYAMCQAQQQSASLGYSPMPINLVEASFEQIRKIPGVEVQQIDLGACRNPTFSPDGTNVLAQNAPQPQECDKQGANQCPDGTGGDRTPTAVKSSAGGGQGGTAAGGGAAGGGGASGGGGAVAPGATGDGAVAGGGTAGGDGVASGGGSTGISGGPTSGGGPVAGGGSSVAAPPGPACDADTGVCGPAPGSASAGGAGGGPGGSPTFTSVGGGPASVNEVAAGLPAVATVLPASKGWSSTQTLMLLITMLVLAVVFVPAYAWHQLSSRAEEAS